MTTLFHYSENPSIEVFDPRPAPVLNEAGEFVWAIDETHAPSYWFPRDCPRACCWTGDPELSIGHTPLLGLGGARRMHAIEMDWLERLRICRLFEYRFDASAFELKTPEAGYWVAREPVRPRSVEPVGDLLARHVEARIEFRVVINLWPLIDAIVASGLQFSVIRKANARDRDHAGF